MHTYVSVLSGGLFRRYSQSGVLGHNGAPFFWSHRRWLSTFVSTNSGTYIPPSLLMKVLLWSQRCSFYGATKIAPAPQSASYSDTFIPTSTNEIAVTGHNIAPSLESHKMVLVPPLAPSKANIPASTTNERVMRHNAAPFLESRKMVHVPPPAPNPSN
ncbi:hypothetical protein SLA2020_445350 [Shorea laevis]